MNNPTPARLQLLTFLRGPAGPLEDGTDLGHELRLTADHMDFPELQSRLHGLADALDSLRNTFTEAEISSLLGERSEP